MPNRSVIQNMTEQNLEEGKRIDVIKKHLKKHKRKYLLGAGVAAAGLGGLEIYGKINKDYYLKNAKNIGDNIEDLDKTIEKDDLRNEDYTNRINAQQHNNKVQHTDYVRKAMKAQKLRPSHKILSALGVGGKRVVIRGNKTSDDY